MSNSSSSRQPAPPAISPHEGVKLLFDYTKFHIGLYTTLGAILVSVMGLKIVAFSLPFLAIAIFALTIAGWAGGVVASTLPECHSIPEFMARVTRPYDLSWFSGRVWARLEHSAFWVAVVMGLFSFLLPALGFGSGIADVGACGGL